MIPTITTSTKLNPKLVLDIIAKKTSIQGNEYLFFSNFVFDGRDFVYIPSTPSEPLNQ
jgi:hypothetical protein